MRNLLARFTEPSSFAGLGLIASVFFKVPQSTIEVVTQAAVAVVGALAVLIPEKKSETK
jgi:peptidoglycan/LPS O-acetylase OafA/YrhL